MKKSFVIALLCASIGLHAQDIAVKQGNFMISAGVGTLSLEGITRTFINTVLRERGDIVSSSSTVPLFFKAEYMISDYVGLGLGVNYSSFSSSFKVDTFYSGSLKFRRPSVLLRCNGHFVQSENWDVFFGVGVGYQQMKIDYADNSPWTPLDGGFNLPLPVTFEGTLGARYFFIPNLGVYAEIGLTRAVFQAGLTAKF